MKHLSQEHGLDDRSTTQSRHHTQAIQQLELQLKKERDRFSAVMSHFHFKQLLARAAIDSTPPSTAELKDQGDKFDITNGKLKLNTLKTICNIKLNYKLSFRLEPISRIL